MKDAHEGNSLSSPVIKRHGRRTDFRLLLLVMPFVIFLFMFHYAMLFGWTFAFVDYLPGRPVFSLPFVGLKYFEKLHSIGSRFPLAFKNTLVYGLLGVVFSPFPVIVAILMAELPKGAFSRAIQTATSFPNFISWILVFSISFVFFGIEGTITKILVRLGIWKEGYNLLGDEQATYMFQTLLGVWKGTGWTAIIYLSSISSIDTALYDAANIDGAGRFQRMYHITLKSLFPTYFVVMILNISSLMNAGFEQFYVFKNALVANRIEVLATFSYQIGIANGEISYGTAISIMQSMMSIFLLFSINSVAKRTMGNHVF